MNFVLLKSFNNYIEANLTLGRLQEGNVRCWLADENVATINPILTNAIGGIKLMVLEEDQEKAVTFLHALEEIKRKNYSCPVCGSGNIESVVNNRKTKNVIISIVTWLLGNYAIGVENIWHCFNCNAEFESPQLNNEENLLFEE
jgi:hypothetical protein